MVARAESFAGWGPAQDRGFNAFVNQKSQWFYKESVRVHKRHHNISILNVGTFFWWEHLFQGKSVVDKNWCAGISDEWVVFVCYVGCVLVQLPTWFPAMKLSSLKVSIEQKENPDLFDQFVFKTKVFWKRQTAHPNEEKNQPKTVGYRPPFLLEFQWLTLWNMNGRNPKVMKHEGLVQMLSLFNWFLFFVRRFLYCVPR